LSLIFSKNRKALRQNGHEIDMGLIHIGDKPVDPAQRRDSRHASAMRRLSMAFRLPPFPHRLSPRARQPCLAMI
jgi:hypothetical protein